MTEQEAAKKWIELLQAFAEGKTIQRADGGHWYEVMSVQHLDLHSNVNYYRIKPEMKTGKYRVVLCRDDNDYYTETVDDFNHKYISENDVEFVEWLTAWVEYEYEEKDGGC